jgi:hypothetical protein
MNLVCERSTDAEFTRDRSRVELKGVYVNSNESSSRFLSTYWQPLAFEHLRPFIVDVRRRAVSTREDAWLH